MDKIKERLDQIHDDLVERYPEQEEGLDLYQAYIHYEFKAFKQRFDLSELDRCIEKAEKQLNN